MIRIYSELYQTEIPALSSSSCRVRLMGNHDTAGDIRSRNTDKEFLIKAACSHVLKFQIEQNYYDSLSEHSDVIISCNRIICQLIIAHKWI